MEKFKVTIMPENITIAVAQGTSLIHAASEAGVNINSPCGGRATCGKCAVRILNGTVDAGDMSHLSEDLRESGYILACNAKVIQDVTVEIPLFSRLTNHSVVLDSTIPKFSRKNGYFADKKLKPVCRKIFLSLKDTELSESMNDLDRLNTVLAKEKGISDIHISLNALRQLPYAIREGDWEITLTVVTVAGVNEIIRVEAGKSDKHSYGVAVDIGTTTVAAYLIDTANGKVLDKSGDYNQQSAYGADVISRIIYTDENADGIEALQKAVVDTVNKLIGQLVKNSGIEHSDISALVCAGNTVMSHMFYGVSAAYLRLDPYVPAAVKFPVLKARELKININPDAAIVMLPSVASYVGGDITSGVLATLITQTEKLTLFIDIGTNGELVLGNNEWMVTCSCSAGPAFEGSGIGCGMRAMDGAIDWIDIDKETQDVKCNTIGDVKPLGICGSGLINSLSTMADAGIIDRAGKILENESNRRIRKSEDGMEYILVYAKDSGTGNDIAISEGDIKNLLRAKGAIFAGIRTMLQQVQMDMSAIENVYIAGGFGKYIDITDAIKIGLLPDLRSNMFEYVGNSSIQGAVIVLLYRDALEEAEEIAGRMTYLELSVGNTFMDEFVSAIFIPHTDLYLFPSLIKAEGAVI